VRIVVRVAGLAAVLAVYYGMAAVLPSRVEAVAGYVAFATVAIGVFVWARRDGRLVQLSEAIRDWLVVAFVVSVIWWVSLVLFEGTDDVIAQLRLDFLHVLSTAGLIFVPALFGALLGSGAGSRARP
jgi:hypothetical protein